MAGSPLAELRALNVKQQRKSTGAPEAAAPPETLDTAPTNEQMSKASNDATLHPSIDASIDTMSKGVNTPSRKASRDRVSKIVTPPVSESLMDSVCARVRAARMDDTGKGATTRLNLDLDEETHLRLRALCLTNRMTVKACVTALVELLLEEEGD